MTNVVVTGCRGFVGSNLCVRLAETGRYRVIGLSRNHPEHALAEAAEAADFVIHLAGVNRPVDDAEYAAGNVGATEELCSALTRAGNGAPILYASSTQAAYDNPYGRSKRGAEEALLSYAEAGGGPVHIFRLTNVFGKWARPNYNSAVATFCHNIARGEDIKVHDPASALRLVYIDDVVDAFLALLDEPPAHSGFHEVEPVYETTVGEVATIIQSFPGSRNDMVTPRVGTGLVRALYSTFLTYLPPTEFEYRVPVHADPRGKFVEMLKTLDSGQMSYFTAGPGITRGDHYHHSKTEKFLVISGLARFAFRHIVTGETHELDVHGGGGRIVETVPGWTHNITNIGKDELIVMLWANEIFDRARPDTIGMKV